MPGFHNHVPSIRNIGADCRTAKIGIHVVATEWQLHELYTADLRQRDFFYVRHVIFMFHT